MIFAARQLTVRRPKTPFMTIALKTTPRSVSKTRHKQSLIALHLLNCIEVLPDFPAARFLRWFAKNRADC